MSNGMSDRSGSEGGFGGWLVRLSDRNRFEASPLGLGPPPQLATVHDRRCVLAGKMHDRRELERAAGLDLDPEANDAAAVLNAYLRLGVGAFSHVKGVFAFALWDGEKLLGVRDRMGVYPLFWAEAQDDVLISTSAAALVAQPGIPSDVNSTVLIDHLRHRWLDREETFFSAVRRVPPGHFLSSTNGTQRLTRYWDPAPPDQEVDWVREDEIGQFDALLQTAVDRCVRAGETGIFLSGGLDSVAVAALAANGEPRPWALSLAFPDPSCNEEEVQRNVATRLGLPQVMLSWDDAVGEHGLVAAGLQLSGGLGFPLINLWAPVYDKLAQEGRGRGCRVILTGTGGDEWLGVSPYYAADLLWRLDFLGVARLVRNLGRSYRLGRAEHLANMLWQFGARPLVKRGAMNLSPGPLTARKLRAVSAGIPEWLAPDAETRRLIVEREVEAYSRSLKPLRRLSRAHPAVYIEQMRVALDHPLVSLELEETYEQGRRLGMTFLHPFLDSDLVEFLYRTPPELLNRGGRSKGLVRESLARRLPELGFGVQRKVVANDFVSGLMAREARPAWQEIGRIPKLVEIGAVDGAAVDDLAERLAGSPSLTDRVRLWNLLSCEIWLRQRGGRDLA